MNTTYETFKKDTSQAIINHFCAEHKTLSRKHFIIS